MQLVSTTDPAFRSKLTEWMQADGELVIMARYSRAAGKKEFEFFVNLGDLERHISGLPHSTCVTVFRKNWLPLRGVVDDAFVERCLCAFTNGAEFLVVDLERRKYGRYAWLHWEAGETHAELREVLEGLRDARVAAGIWPQYDGESSVTAYLPDENGKLVLGIY